MHISFRKMHMFNYEDVNAFIADSGKSLEGE